MNNYNSTISRNNENNNKQDSACPNGGINCSNEDNGLLVIGMSNKVMSKPMLHLLEQLKTHYDLKYGILNEAQLLEQDYKEWPYSPFIFTFESLGHPLIKVMQYVTYYSPQKPITYINNPFYNHLLTDRRLMLMLLDFLNIPTINRLIVNNNKNKDLDIPQIVKDQMDKEVLEYFDYWKSNFNNKNNKVEYLYNDKNKTVLIGLKQINKKGNIKYIMKPFVEKPTDANDHNINIYYENGKGGRSLFRKRKDKSSEYSKDLNLTRSLKTSSSSSNDYIYEEYKKSDKNQDIKVYTIGQNYIYAQARKYTS